MPIRREFNKDFFKKWSSDMAYILGFLFADGNIIRTKRGTHFVALYTADYDLLFSIRELLDSNHKISERASKSGAVYVLQIGSKELFDDLNNLGLTVNKSRRMKLPIIPQKFSGDFVRGYFDGDGCVWKGISHRQRVKKTDAMLVSFTSASFDFLKGLLSLLRGQGVMGGSLFKSRVGNYSRLSFGTLDSLKMHKIMYNDATKLFLARKKLIFEDFIKMRP